MSTGKKVWLIVGIVVSVLLTVAIGLGAFMLLTGQISIDKHSVNAKPVTLQDDQLQPTVQQVESTVQQVEKAANDIASLQDYLSQTAIGNHFETLYGLTADLSNAPGEEALFLCHRSGEYCTVVVGVNNNAYFSSPELRDAIYLVSLNGKPHLMSYYMNKRDGGASYYSYVIYRIAANGDLVSVEENDYTLSPNQQDATAAANFFNRFNAYTNNMTVVYDPYRLTGQQWVTPDNATYGTPPDEPMDATGEQLGYVQIKDPKSWLNLREGPGTNYPCIYLEPGNKKSIVKQAQGSPVTILETINTGDAKNPVWYKVRINYAGREIVGYSSQTFIRLANE